MVEIDSIAENQSAKKDICVNNDKKDKIKSKKDKKRKRSKEEKDAVVDSSKSHKKEKKEKKEKSEKKQKSKRDKGEKEEKDVKASVSNDSTVDIQKWYKDNEIVVTDLFDTTRKWQPFLSFAETSLSQQVLDGTTNFSKPTPIQSVCWPILLQGRDIIGIAETGSGKTLGFGLPAIEMLHQTQKSAQNRRPSILIMTPTRELAIQIQEQFVLFSKKVDCESLCVFGGIAKWEQREKIKQGVDVIIACPGRLADLMQEGSIDLQYVKYVVLDEADRLLDSGFEKEIRSILSSTSSQRQMAMFSATWPAAVEALANEYLRKAVKVTIGSPDLGANANVSQIVEVIEPMQKERRLLKLLQQYHSSRSNRILVFALYKKEAARLEQFLMRNGWKCICIHGDMSQDSRTKSFQQFKAGTVPLLIATDVAARGLDIPNVEYVINYTFPLTIEDYVHRIGRTGRAGKTGISHTFFTAHDKSKSGELINLLKQTEQPVPESLLAFGTTVKKKEHSVYGAFFKEIDPTAKATKITFDDSDNE